MSTIRLGRRHFLAGGAAAVGALGAGHRARAATKGAPSGRELDRVAAAPGLRRELFKSPVIIDKLRLLKRGDEVLVHVRSKDGAEGIAVTTPPRPEYLDRIFTKLVVPNFVGKD